MKVNVLLKAQEIFCQYLTEFLSWNLLLSLLHETFPETLFNFIEILKGISFKIPFKKCWKRIFYQKIIVFDCVTWEWHSVFWIQLLKQLKKLANFASMYSFNSLLSLVRVNRYAHAHVYSRNLNKNLMYVQLISRSHLKLSWF